MLRVRIDAPLREQWTPVVARHFQMTLASAISDLRDLTVRFRTQHDGPDTEALYACELRGRHRDGREVRIHSTHVDGETAIGSAFSRVRRELRRRRMDLLQRAGTSTTASSSTLAGTSSGDHAPTHDAQSSANSL